MIAIMQPRGVMVAQVILVHFVEVRILTGLPFFCPKILNCKQRVCWKTSFPHTLFLTVLLRHGICPAVRIFYDGCLVLLALAGLRYSGSLSRRILTHAAIFFCFISWHISRLCGFVHSVTYAGMFPRSLIAKTWPARTLFRKNFLAYSFYYSITMTVSVFALCGSALSRAAASRRKSIDKLSISAQII